MRTGRPVLVYDPDPNFGRLLAHFPNYPQGPLIRLLPRGQSVPDLESLTKRNLELLDQFTLEPKPTPQQRWSFHVYRRYAQPFHFLASEWQEAGDAKRAATMRSMADRFDPVASPEQRGGP